MSTSFTVLFCLVVVALVSCPVTSQVNPITISWSTSTLPTPTRGMGCGAYKPANLTSSLPRFQGGHNLTATTDNEYRQFTTNSSYERNNHPFGFPVREGHAYLNTRNADGPYEAIWGGIDGTGALLDDMFDTPGVLWEQGTVDSTFTPRFNMSYTQVLDQSSLLIVGVSYGGLVSNGQGGFTPTDDIFQVPVSPGGRLLRQGTAPFGSRTGMSMSSFNGTAGYIVMMGGVYWPQDATMPTFYNVLSTAPPSPSVIPHPDNPISLSSLLLFSSLCFRMCG
jgi:hypothetical protein